jgi:hypothetical protein
MMLVYSDKITLFCGFFLEWLMIGSTMVQIMLKFNSLVAL